MVKETEFENFKFARISNFQGLVTLTLIGSHHGTPSSTSTYLPNFIQIAKQLAADIWTDQHRDWLY